MKQVTLRFAAILLLFALGTVLILKQWNPLLLLLLAVTLLLVPWAVSPLQTSLTRFRQYLERLSPNRIVQRFYVQPQDVLYPIAATFQQLMEEVEVQLQSGLEDRQRLYGLLESMDSGVILVDAEGRTLLVNRATEQLLGRSRESWIGRLHLEVTHHYELGQMIDHCLQTGERSRQELSIYYPQERILDIQVSPITDVRGGQAGAVAVMHDITAIRRLENIRRQFVANVSHELRTPLTAVKGFAETLADESIWDNRETVRQFLSIIQTESERLYRLIGDLLDLSRIESNQLPMRWEILNLKEHLNNVVQLVRPEVEKKSLHLRVEIPEGAEVEADADAVSQMVLNLLSNAITYTPSGGEIVLMVEQGEEGVWIRVRDTGIGIPQKHLKHIFERFYRVDRSRLRQSGGTGLGLSIAKHLAEAHQGKIEAESVWGEGSCFSIYLPHRQRPRRRSSEADKR